MLLTRELILDNVMYERNTAGLGRIEFPSERDGITGPAPVRPCPRTRHWKV